ncbi:MAG: efflux RND transporter periplasmic adaptor subunit [Gammaproteobacteria bacterium]
MLHSPSGQTNRLRITLAALLSLSTLAGCGPPPAPQAPPPLEVGALEVKPQALTLSLEHAAQLRGVREVEVRARVSGILLKRLYTEGSRVKEGELLFRIDPAPFQAQVAKARADLGVQQANLQATRRERDRILPLYEQKLISLRDRDNAVAAYESAAASAAATEAALKSAQLDLSYTDVRAPISGLTSREARSEGSLVTAASDSSLLTHIVQADRLYVQFSVPEAEAASIRGANSGGASNPVTVDVLEPSGKVLASGARVEFISPAVGDQTGTVDVRAILPNPQNMLPGQVVRARVNGVTLASSLVIPKRAVMHGVQGSFVWLIGAGDKVEFRPVQLGITAANNVVVDQGLKAGERIVVDGILKVQPGAVVKGVPLAAEASPGAPGAPPAVAATEEKTPS